MFSGEGARLLPSDGWPLLDGNVVGHLVNEHLEVSWTGAIEHELVLAIETEMVPMNASSSVQLHNDDNVVSNGRSDPRSDAYRFAKGKTMGC